MKYPRIGEVSSGTLSPDDLIPCFAGLLEDYRQGTDYDDILSDANDWQDDADPDPDVASELVNELIEALTQIAPPYVVFGASEGDGASFGFWPDMESLTADVEAGDVLKLNEGDPIPPGEQRPVMFVSDHGNVRLLIPVTSHVEAWSAV